MSSIGMDTISTLQVWLATLLRGDSAIDRLMQTTYGWPIAESFHFLGLCLLIGTVGVFDLRLLGIAKQVPIAAVHRLIPFGLIGFAVNVTTGLMFFVTEPYEYIYNSSFHLKLVFLAVAGVNASLFYLTSYRQVFGDRALLDAPRRAKVIAIVSLCMWILVITCGRLITFYRPGRCSPEEAAAVVLTCVP